MAEAVALCASIIALVQGGGMLVQGLNQLRRALNAPREIAKLLEEIQDVAHVVSILQSHLEQQPRLNRQAEQYLLGKLRQAEGIVAVSGKLQTFIRKCTQKVKAHNVVTFLWADVTGEITRHCDTLESIKNALSQASVFNMFTAQTVYPTAILMEPVIETIVYRIAQRIIDGAAVTPTLEAVVQTNRPIEASPENLTSTASIAEAGNLDTSSTIADGLDPRCATCGSHVADANALISIQRPGPNLHASSDDESRDPADSNGDDVVGMVSSPSVRTMSANQSLLGTSSEDTQYSITMSSFKTCAFRPCGCRCHRRTSITLPKLFRPAAGALRINIQGIHPGSTSCDVAGCASSTFDLRLSYTFPSWLLNRMIYVKCAGQRSVGPELLLRTYRVRPLVHVYHALVWGNIDLIRNELGVKQLSVYDIDELGTSLLSILCQFSDSHHYPQLITSLVRMGADLYQENCYGRSPYTILWTNAAHRARPPLLTTLPEATFDEDRLKLTQLHSAILGLPGSTSLDTALCSTPRSEIDTYDAMGWTALSRAVRVGHEEGVRMLLKKGANPNHYKEQSFSAGFAAVIAKRLDILLTLLDAGLDLNQKDQDDQTLLHVVVVSIEDQDCIHFINGMLHNGAEINARNGRGHTPLTYLCGTSMPATECRSQILRILLQHGANAHSITNNGKSALCLAVVDDEPLFVAPLLEHDRTLAKYLSWDNQTILHLAAINAGKQCLELLRNVVGLMDADAMDHDRFTALDCALFRYQHHDEWARLLGRTRDEDPKAWFDAFCDLCLEVAEARCLEAASNLMDGLLLDVDIDHSDDDHGRMPGSFPAD